MDGVRTVELLASTAVSDSVSPREAASCSLSDEHYNHGCNLRFCDKLDFRRGWDKGLASGRIHKHVENCHFSGVMESCVCAACNSAQDVGTGTMQKVDEGAVFQIRRGEMQFRG